MKWLKRFILILSIAAIVSTTIVMMFLYPGWAYAHQTTHKTFTIFHDSALPDGWASVIDQVQERIEGSGINDKTLRYKICLKDGSSFPELIESVTGESFAFAGVNVIIMQSAPDLTAGIANRGELKYDLISLLSHEAIHCQEYRHQGFWGANPMAGHPVWKWEGYAELKGRGPDFIQNEEQLQQLWQSTKQEGWVIFDDQTMVHSSYLRFALLSKLCLEANNNDFGAFLEDQHPESFWAKEMEKLTRSTYLGA